MLDINENYSISSVLYLQEYPVIYVDNFLTNPHKLVDYLYLNEPKNLWKYWETPSYNGVHFADKRHDIVGKEVEAYNLVIQNILEKFGVYQRPGYLDIINSNFTTFFDHSFNNYKDCYWAPHADNGYNAILYLNTTGCNGTNLYIESIQQEEPDAYEHLNPWKPKHNYKVIFNVKSKFNRLVLFNGKILHGMAINDNRFFNKQRINVVTFFRET